MFLFAVSRSNSCTKSDLQFDLLGDKRAECSVKGGMCVEEWKLPTSAVLGKELQAAKEIIKTIRFRGCNLKLFQAVADRNGQEFSESVRETLRTAIGK